MSKMLRTAVIMAGGQGTRLSSITGPLPKAMVNIHGTQHENSGKAKDTILEHQIKMLSENGITNFIFVVGNKKEYIEEAFTNEIINANIPNRNISIQFFEEERPFGTAGAFCSKDLQSLIGQEDFLFTYSDVLFDVNVQKMYEEHQQQNADATVLISPCSDPDDRPLCVLDKSHTITGLIPKQGKNDGPRGSVFQNTPKNGLMILSSSFLKVLPEDPTYLDMEENILTKLIYNDNYHVHGWNTPCYIKDIGTVDRFHEGVKDLSLRLPEHKNPEKFMQKCIIFNEKDLIDINEEGQVHAVEQVCESIVKCNNKGVITLLHKDSDLISSHPKGDHIVDTLLTREGDGAFVNGKFETFEEFEEFIQNWNIDSNQCFSIESIENGCILSLLNGENEKTYQPNIIGATHTALSLMQNIPTPEYESVEE